MNSRKGFISIIQKVTSRDVTTNAPRVLLQGESEKLILECQTITRTKKERITDYDYAK